MKKSGTLLKSLLAVILSAVIILSALSTAFAAQVTNKKQVRQYLETFNSSVNAIKKETPAFHYHKEAGISQDEEITIVSKNAAELSDEARKYLGILVDAFFNPEKGLVNNFIAVLTGTDSEITDTDVYKGMENKNLLSPKGKNYISALTAEDEFSLYAEKKTNALDSSKDSTKIRVTFPEYDLETVKDSSLKKMFDLPSGAINPVLVGSEKFDDANDPLDEIKFDNFTFHDAYAQAELDGNGQITKYTQNISYTFSISFYDMLRIFSVYADTDLIEIGLAIANPILAGTGQPEITAREALKSTILFIQYDILTELTRFDWEPRGFGDVDNNGTVAASDARSALRYSVGLESFNNQENLIYADVNFDGSVTAADARNILRMSVDLEQKFSEVPEGESIKIIVLIPPESEEPEEPENEGATDAPETGEPDGEEGNNVVDEMTGDVSEFITSIFDFVNGFTGDEITNEGVAGLIQDIKDIIAIGKGEMEYEAPDESTEETAEETTESA